MLGFLAKKDKSAKIGPQQNTIEAMNITGNELKQIIESLERLEEEKQAVLDQVKDLLKDSEAKGYDTKIIKLLLKERKMEAHKLEEQESLLDTYRAALN
jgi:uncharacterized protein (UPF0335 family)